jgi:hypothetical protein
MLSPSHPVERFFAEFRGTWTERLMLRTNELVFPVFVELFVLK